MKLIRKIIITVISLALALPLTACAPSEASANEGFNIVTSFYPMQILVMNIAGGIDGVNVSCMSEPDIGCIHDHVFTTEDLRLIENADVYVENGLGLETFNDQILSAYPGLQIIEAAADVTDAPAEEDGEEVNGHVWTSIDDYILMIRQVGDRLSDIDPEHADIYEANASSYIDRVENIQSSNLEIIASLEGRGALVLDESLPSFCVYTGMNYRTLETDHEQSALSAGDIRELIEYMNGSDVDVIFVGTDSDSDIAQTIADETGASIYVLNTMITGPVEADAYITQMTENFEILSEMN
ncbi:MAG: zinc ABC transporter substrate-binding protein [Clostridiales bacterium]|nr:zinc ABC transporter substrate-binding protein [Clostridiales bacterium]